MKNLIGSYDVLDMCYGEMTGKCKSGAFIKLDNGESAFAYSFSGLPCGSRVLCSVRKAATEGRKILVSIDSVTYYAPFAA